MVFNNSTTNCPFVKSPCPPPFPDLAELRFQLDRIDLDGILSGLKGRHSTGRKPFPRRPILRAHLAAYALGVPNVSALVRRLQNDPALRSVCGFTSRLPHRTTFCRVFQFLALECVAQVEACFGNLTRRLAELLPGFGQDIAADSTTIPAWANPSRKSSRRNPGGPADPEASWTRKHSAQDESGEEWVFGYKVHAVADANFNLPITMTATTASRNDSPLLQPLLEKAESQNGWFSLGPGSAVMADRGYDSRSNNEYVHRRGAAPVIHKRKPSNGQLHGGIYTTDGVPVCLGGQEMMYVRTDPESGQHLYRCPPEGCRRQGQVRGYAACGDWGWEDPKQDIRLFGGRIRRGSPQWREKYAKRWSVERMFSQWKYPGRLERHRYFGLAKVRMHAMFQMLMSQAIALAAVKQPDCAAL